MYSTGSNHYYFLPGNFVVTIRNCKRIVNGNLLLFPYKLYHMKVQKASHKGMLEITKISDVGLATLYSTLSAYTINLRSIVVSSILFRLSNPPLSWSNTSLSMISPTAVWISAKGMSTFGLFIRIERLEPVDVLNTIE